MKEQLDVTHTICQSEIPALIDNWAANASSVKTMQKKKSFHLYFCKNITGLILTIKNLSGSFLTPVKLCIREFYVVRTVHHIAMCR